MSSILAATKAVAFAEDSYFDAFKQYEQGSCTRQSLLEVSAALAQVRRIAAAGIEPQEAA